jgi:hypothetical protein
MKEEVILRILAQESPKSELWLRRYREKKLRGPLCNFWKWLGLYLELFSETRGLVRNFRGLRLDYKERQGANVKIGGDFLAQIFFQ